MGLSPLRDTLTPSPIFTLAKENFATLYCTVLEEASVHERVCSTPFPAVPSLADQEGVGPLVLKASVPELKLIALSDVKVAVESAQSVPWELVAATR